MQSRFSSKRHDSFSHYNGLDNNKGNSEVLAKDKNLKKNSEKKGGLKSLKVLAAILLSKMGRMGARDLLGLVAIVVSNFLCTSEVQFWYFILFYSLEGYKDIKIVVISF